MPKKTEIPGLVARPSLPVRELATVGCLPSDLKAWVYRRRGYRVGDDVHIGLGSLVLGKDVEIEDGVSIGPGVIIRGDRVRIGRGANIGALTVISSRAINIGEDAVINDRVFVSSGAPNVNSAFSIGERTILMRHAYVNCLHEVKIGDGTGIGGHCLLFTHGYWLNWFQGYPRQLAPIHIGKDVWLPWRVFVMPGATIGDGTVIGANSLVSGNIPPYSLAAGSPAKVVEGKRYEGSLPIEQVAKKLDEFLKDFFGGLEGLGVKIDGKSAFDTAGNGYALRVIGHGEAPPTSADTFHKSETVVSLAHLDDAWRHTAETKEIAWFDLSSWERSDRQNPLGKELVSHFQSYGVRFKRC